jgi:WD40 repeat protein
VLYKAFMSYSRAADGRLAPVLQASLQQFARPWNHLRAIRIFRDKTGLSPSPGLWSAIESALSESEYFLLLASPAAASSDWVNRELRHWLEYGNLQRLVLVLTAGEVFWDRTANDFDWQLSTALPRALEGKFSQEPLYVDLRWAADQEQLSIRNPRFQDAVAELASALHGVSKDELFGEDVRQHKRLVFLQRAALGVLMVLVLGLAVAVWVANRQRELATANANLARDNADVAKSNERRAKAAADRLEKANTALKTALTNENIQRQRAVQGEAEAKTQKQTAERRAEETLVANLTLQSELAQSSSPIESLRLALDAAERAASPATTRRLIQALLAAKPTKQLLGRGARIVHVNWMRDSSLLVARENGDVLIYPYGAEQPIVSQAGPGVKLISGCSDTARSALLSDAGHIYVYTASPTGNAAASTGWDSKSDPRLGCVVDPSSPWVVTFDSAKHAFAWDADARVLVRTTTLTGVPVTASAFTSFGAFLFGHNDGTVEEWRTLDNSISTVASLPRPIFALSKEPLGARVFAAAGGEGHILDAHYKDSPDTPVSKGSIVNAQWLVSGEIVCIDESGNVLLYDKNGQLRSAIRNPDGGPLWARQMMKLFLGKEQLLEDLRQYAVAPLEYGTKLLAVSEGVRVWDRDWAQPVAFLGPEPSPARMVAASYSRVALGYPDGTLLTWDPMVRGLAPPISHSAAPDTTAWSPDGKYLGVAESSPEASRFRVWDPEGRVRYFGSRGRPITEIAWHPFRPEVYLISRGCGITRLRYFEGFVKVAEEEIMKPQFDTACYASWSPDGQTLALSPFLAPTVILWQTGSSRAETLKLDRKRYAAAHSAPQWFADSKSVLAAGAGDHIVLSSTGSVQRWISSDEKEIRHDGANYRLLIEKDGNLRHRLHKEAASDVSLASELWEACKYVSWNRDATSVACAKDSQLQVITREGTSVVDLGSTIFGLLWSPDGNRVLVDDTDQFTIVEPKRSVWYSIPHETPSPGRSAAWHPAGTVVALSWSGRGQTELWPGSLDELRALGRERVRSARGDSATKPVRHPAAVGSIEILRARP